MKEVIKEYSNGEVTIVWKPDLCIHSRVCWHKARGLPEVFDPTQRPWIKPEGAPTERIIDQVSKCPSGALTCYMNGEEPAVAATASETIVEITPNGPLMVYGNLTVKDKDGNETRRNKVTAFCRCGASSNKPYCDGTHVKIGFKG